MRRLAALPRPARGRGLRRLRGRTRPPTSGRPRKWRSTGPSPTSRFRRTASASRSSCARRSWRATRASTGRRSGSPRPTAGSPARPRSPIRPPAAPRWSPDGKWIAFISKRGERYANVWLLPTGRRSVALTDRDGGRLAASLVARREVARLHRRGAAPDDKERRDRERDDARVVGQDDRPGRLWVMQRPAGRRRRARGAAAPGDELVGRRHARQRPRRRGARLVARRKDDRLRAHHAPGRRRWPTSDITLVDVETGAVRPFAHTGASEMSPRFSPDGKWIAYRRPTIRRAGRTGSGSGSRRWTAARGATCRHSFDDAQDLAGWSADGQTLYFTESKGVYDLLYAQNVRDRRDHDADRHGESLDRRRRQRDAAPGSASCARR